MSSASRRRSFLLAAIAAFALSPRLEARPLYRTLFHGFDFGGASIGVQLQDLNGDARLDLVALVFSPASVLVRLGDGDGDFGSPTSLSLPGQPSAFAVANLNADSYPDLLITNGASTLSIFCGAGDGTFGPRLDVLVGGNPAGVAVGDVNEDGRQDVAVTSGASLEVQILFGFMDNFFYPITDIRTGIDPAAVALRDVSGDGHLDLVILNRGSSTISVFLGDGAGGFAAPLDLAGMSSMRDIAVDDLNGDGNLDIAATNGTAALVSIYLGLGGGSFGALTAFPAGATPGRLAVATMNGDSIPDLLIANTTPNAANLLLGNGDGSFAAPIAVRTEVAPVAVATGDLDGDGSMDFAVANAKAITVHLGNGDGTFGTQTNTYDVGPGHKVVAIADLDDDGALDLAVTSYSNATLSILFGRGDGTFEAGPVLPTPVNPHDVATGDLNEDGREDLVIVNDTANSYTIFMGNGPRGWSTGVTTPLATGPIVCALEDLNGDHHLDLVVLKYQFVDVLLGLGDGTFAPRTSYRAADWDATDLEIADVNLDGNLDMVVAQNGCCPGKAWVLLGNGDGTFQPRSLIFQEEYSWASTLAVGQFNADSNPDVSVGLFWAGQTYQLSVLYGHGDGSFEPRSDVGAAYRPAWVEVGDLNRDGYNDLVLANRDFPWTTSVHLGHGDGTFLPRLDFGIGGGATCVKIADLDTDGDADLVVGDTNSNRIWVLLSQRAIPTDAGEPAPQTAGQATPSLAAAERVSGQVRISYALAVGAPRADVAIYDARGRLVRALEPALARPGRNTCDWNRCDARGARVARGVYFVRLRALDASATCKVVLVRP